MSGAVLSLIPFVLIFLLIRILIGFRRSSKTNIDYQTQPTKSGQSPQSPRGIVLAILALLLLGAVASGNILAVLVVLVLLLIGIRRLSGRSPKTNINYQTHFGDSFNFVNPKAVEWAKQHAAENIAGLSSETKAAIRSLVVRAFTEGIPPRALAKEIRPFLTHTEDERGLIALRQKELQAKRYKGLRLEKAITKYAEKILATRASSIAVTQIRLASNQGQLESWRQAKEQGFLRGDEHREWIGPRRSDSCEACRAMNGKKARLNEPFETPFGPIMGPPLHDECSCSIVLARPEGEEE